MRAVFAEAQCVTSANAAPSLPAPRGAMYLGRDVEDSSHVKLMLAMQYEAMDVIGHSSKDQDVFGSDSLYAVDCMDWRGAQNHW